MARSESSTLGARAPFSFGEAVAASFAPAKPRKPQERSTRTRELLLEAAGAIFVRDGYEKAALTEIARMAGKTRGAIYSHFKDKEEIFVTLVECQALRRGTRLQEMLAELSAEEGLSSKSFQRFIGSMNNAQEGVLLMEFLLYALRHPHLNNNPNESF